MPPRRNPAETTRRTRSSGPPADSAPLEVPTKRKRNQKSIDQESDAAGAVTAAPGTREIKKKPTRGQGKAKAKRSQNEEMNEMQGDLDDDQRMEIDGDDVVRKPKNGKAKTTRTTRSKARRNEDDDSDDTDVTEPVASNENDDRLVQALNNSLSLEDAAAEAPHPPPVMKPRPQPRRRTEKPSKPYDGDMSRPIRRGQSPIPHPESTSEAMDIDAGNGSAKDMDENYKEDEDDEDKDKDEDDEDKEDKDEDEDEDKEDEDEDEDEDKGDEDEEGEDKDVDEDKGDEDEEDEEGEVIAYVKNLNEVSIAELNASQRSRYPAPRPRSRTPESSGPDGSEYEGPEDEESSVDEGEGEVEAEEPLANHVPTKKSSKAAKGKKKVSPTQVDDDADDDQGTAAKGKGKKKNKAGRLPQAAIDEVRALKQDIERRIHELAEKYKHPSTTFFRLLQDINSPKETNPWNLFQSYYGAHHRRPKNTPLPDWIRTEVKGEYAKLTALDQKEYDAKLQEMHEWLDEGLGVIVEDRHKSGKIEGDVLKMAARYSDLARNDFHLYDVHIVGYIFALSETAEGRSIYQLFSGTPLFDNILNKEWGANLRKAMKEMESVLIVENARKRAADNPDIAPPEPFLVEVNFERSRTDSRIQATHRRVVPLLYHAMSRMALTQRIRNGGAPVNIPSSMHWAKWADEGSKLFLAFINWPADIPVPDGSNSDPDYKYDFRAVFSSHLRIIYESWKKHKEGNLPEAEAEKLMRIVSWSDDDINLNLLARGDIALITNVNGQVLLRVRDSPTWQRAVEAEQARVAKLVAPPPPVKEKVSKPKHKGGSGLPGPSFQPAHHVPMPGYIETSSPPQELLTLPPDFHPDDQEDQESSSPKRPSPKRAKVDDKSKGKKKKKN